MLIARDASSLFEYNRYGISGVFEKTHMKALDFFDT